MNKITKEESLRLSGIIGKVIAEKNPRLHYTTADVENNLAKYSDAEIKEMRDIGLLTDDHELYYVLQSFWAHLVKTESEIGGEVDGNYILELFRSATRPSALDFRTNPYISTVKVPDIKKGNFTLTTASYGRGEIFQNDMPDFGAEIVVPKLAFFDRTVKFPAIYEGNTPWMSVCPSEINSMKRYTSRAYGNILVLGLGLGYYPFMISSIPTVSSITIIERQPEIIELFSENILPQFPNGDKIKIVRSDAFEYMDCVNDGDYSMCFCDIWQGAADGVEAYKKLKEYESRLPGTFFMYWIEEQLKEIIKQQK